MSRTSYLGMIEAEFLWNVVSSWPAHPSKREIWKNRKYPIHSIYHTFSDAPICRAERETQTQRADLWTQRRKEREGWPERAALIHLPYMCKAGSLGGSGCTAQGAQLRDAGGQSGAQTIYEYSERFTSSCSRNWHNIVKQSYSKKT